jgi:hypothetical protein
MVYIAVAIPSLRKILRKMMMTQKVCKKYKQILQYGVQKRIGRYLMRAGRKGEKGRYHAKRIRKFFCIVFKSCPINIGLIQNLIFKFRLP